MPLFGRGKERVAVSKRCTLEKAAWSRVVLTLGADKADVLDDTADRGSEDGAHGDCRSSWGGRGGEGVLRRSRGPAEDGVRRQVSMRVQGVSLVAQFGHWDALGTSCAGCEGGEAGDTNRLKGRGRRGQAHGWRACGGLARLECEGRACAGYSRACTGSGRVAEGDTRSLLASTTAGRPTLARLGRLCSEIEHLRPLYDTVKRL